VSARVVNHFFFLYFLLLLILNTPPKYFSPDILESPEHLWSEHGLRSISTKSPFYQRWNNKHDKPYWRGPVWINVNYLAVDALGHYARADGPHAARCAALRRRLASVVSDTVWRGVVADGFVFENYNDATGRGMGCKPFTGWSALAVLLAGVAAE
jgi:mannosyl-oligosaccharide glucosidase